MEECDEFSTITPGTVVYVQEGTDVRGYRSVSYHGTVIEVLKGGYFKVRKHSVDSTKVVRMEHGNHLKPPRFSSYDQTASLPITTMLKLRSLLLSG